MSPILFQTGNTSPDNGAQSGTLVAILIAVCVGVVDQLLKRYSVRPAVQTAAQIEEKSRRRRSDDDENDRDFDDEAASTVYKILQPQITEVRADISRIYEKLEEMSVEMNKPIQVVMDVSVKGDK